MEADVEDFLARAAHAAGVSKSELLRRVLRIDGVLAESAAADVLGRMNDPARILLRALDEEVRVLDPRISYVVKGQYIGYARTSPGRGDSKERRSAVFLSVLPRQADSLRLVLPVDPSKYSNVSIARDVREVGHHGVGDLEVTLSSLDDVQFFVSTFFEWLRAKSW